MLRRLAGILVLIAAIGVGGALSSIFPGDSGLLPRICVDLALLFVTILVHELGHAAMAARLGAQVQTIAVLPIEYGVIRGKIRLRWRMGHGDLGGYVSYALDAIDARRKHGLIALAGPAANIGLALGAGAVASAYGSVIAAALAFQSAGLAIANLVPFEGSDGAGVMKWLLPNRRKGAAR